MSQTRTLLIGGALAASLVGALGAFLYTASIPARTTAPAVPPPVVMQSTLVPTAVSDVGAPAILAEQPVQERNEPLPAADPTDQRAETPAPDAPSDRADGDVRIEAPSTEVRINPDRGGLRVRAPHTEVDVDRDKGRVRVRAPFVNLDIS